ncbi:type 4a pilus biogenesis protein PilO [Patescibacteria group bacterium]|nr:type 4a pilus biogenesis protein PilO [Patescibacteria group bacterium]
MMIVIVMVLIILGSGYYIFIKERVADIQEIGVVDLSSRLAILDSRQRTLQSLDDLNKKYESVTSDQLKQLQYVLPQKSEIPQLMIELKNFVESNQLNLAKLESGPLTVDGSEGTDQSIKSLNITMSISGINSYFLMKDFLDKLSGNLPLLELTSLSYSPGTQNYSLNLTLFYQ